MPSTREQGAAGHPELRRRFVLLLPAVFITYSLAYLDRANFGFGAAAGLAQTLGITGSQLSLLTAFFFLGYFFFQIPGAAIARRFGAGRLVFLSLVSWGILAALTGVIRSFWLLALDRFLIGVAESIILPVMLILLSSWFTRRERSRANTVLILGNPVTVLWMSALTGILIDRLGWQTTFVLEGIPSIVWAFVWIALVRDRPEDVRWLSPEAVAELNATVAHEQTGLRRDSSRWRTLLRFDVVLLSLQYFCWSLGIYGFVSWLPTIVRQASSHAGATTSMQTTGLLSAIPYGVSVLGMVAMSILSDRSLRRVSLVWPSLLVAGLAMFASYFATGRSFRVSFFFMIVAAAGMYAPYGPYFAMIPERVAANASGEVTALVNSSGALGGFVGSYLVGWLQAATGNAGSGFLLMATAVTASSFLLFLLPPTEGSPASPALRDA